MASVIQRMAGQLADVATIGRDWTFESTFSASILLFYNNYLRNIFKYEYRSTFRGLRSTSAGERRTETRLARPLAFSSVKVSYRNFGGPVRGAMRLGGSANRAASGALPTTRSCVSKMAPSLRRCRASWHSNRRDHGLIKEATNAQTNYRCRARERVF